MIGEAKIGPHSIPVTTHGLDYMVNLSSGNGGPGGQPTGWETSLDANALGRADQIMVLEPGTARLVAVSVSQWGSDTWTTEEDPRHGDAIDLDDPVWWVILHCAEFITGSEAAVIMGLSSGDGARRQLDRWAVPAIGRAPGRGGESLYLMEEVRAAVKNRPGRGARTDLAIHHTED